jgi:mRNA interferase MazF
MIKDYFLQLLGWWRASVVISSRPASPTFKEGEVWWCSIGMNIGREIFGKGKDFARPVVIFKKIGSDSFLAIPLTTQIKNGSWYVPIWSGDIECRALLSQVRVLDEKRLINKMGTLNLSHFTELKGKFLEFYSS